MNVEMSAWVSLRVKVMSVQDVHDLSDYLKQHRVDYDTPVELGRGDWLYVLVSGDGDNVPAEWIECGDHVPPESRYDVLVTTHIHPHE